MPPTLRRLLVPDGSSRDAASIVAARGLRGFVDGLVSVLLATYLLGIGYSPLQVSAVVTATLLGSAALTLGVGLVAHRLRRRSVLLAACGLMFGTGLGFAGVTAFWPLLLIAAVGTLNPSSGDVSLFLPTEQPALVQGAGARRRIGLFVRYNLAGTFAGALGALASGLPGPIASGLDLDLAEVQRSAFLFYSAAAVLLLVLYARLSPAIEAAVVARPGRPLQQSRGIVLRLAALFSLDSFGGGFVVQSLLALWLSQRFGLSVEAMGAVFFASGIISAFSQVAAGPLALRIGMINTMAFTHIPASLFLIAAALAPTAPLAVAFLLLRMVFAAMDVPVRQAYVMAVVPDEERGAAASVTNVPRSLATTVSPLLAGLMLNETDFGWPLIAGGVIKIAYDLLLLAQFRRVEVPESGR